MVELACQASELFAGSFRLDLAVRILQLQVSCVGAWGHLGTKKGGCKQVILMRRPAMYRDSDLPNWTRLPSGFERRRIGDVYRFKTQ